MPRQTRLLHRRFESVAGAGGALFHDGIVGSCHYRGQIGAQCGHRHRVGGEGGADPAVPWRLVAQRRFVAASDSLGHPPHCGRHSARDRLAANPQVRLKSVDAGVAAIAGRDGVGFVDQQQRAGVAGQPAERIVETVVGQDHRRICHHRLGDDARNVARRERVLERGKVVELDNCSARREVAMLTEQAGAGLRSSLVELDHAFVDGAVIAAVEHQDLGPPGDRARDPQGEAVCIGRRQRNLPHRQPEGLAEQLPDYRRVFGREHVGKAARCLLGHRRDHRRAGMAEHRAGVAKAEVGIVMPVDIGQAATLAAIDEQRKGQRPVGHPLHWDAINPAIASLRRERRRTRPRGTVQLLLGRPKGAKPRQLDPAEHCHQASSTTGLDGCQ